MKTRMAGLMLLLAMGGLAACALADENDGTFRPETWTTVMTIEPEYVLGSGWEGVVMPMMAAVEGTRGEQESMRLTLDGIENFDYEEGYRYTLDVDVTTCDPAIADGPAYTYRLRRVLKKEYVGIGQTGRRDVVLEVRPALVRPADLSLSWEHRFLSARVAGSGESLVLRFSEIYGLDYGDLYAVGTDGRTAPNRLRLKVSITPSAESIYRGVSRRIRLLEVLDKETLANDSIVYADNWEDYV